MLLGTLGCQDFCLLLCSSGSYHVILADCATLNTLDSEVETIAFQRHKTIAISWNSNVGFIISKSNIQK